MSDPKPMSMAESAVAMHELFLSLVKAGFSEQQALYLVGQALRAGSSGSPG